MLRRVELDTQLDAREWLAFADEERKQAILDLAKELSGKKVIHVNATAVGGGVAEILKSLVPYLNSLGLEAQWHVIDPSAGEEFFAVTNKLHNALQGSEVEISEEEWQRYEEVNRIIMGDLESVKGDVLAINDPQPLMAGSGINGGVGRVYFSHIDTSNSQSAVWARVLSWIKSYRQVIFSNRDFVHSDIPPDMVRIFTPAIDPLVLKQRIVSRKEAREYLQEHGDVPVDCPLVVQVSRFDVWKNPFGVLEAFKAVLEKYPDAHLALAGFKEAKDNPAAEKVYEEVAVAASGIENVHLFYEPEGRNIAEYTMMLQNGADVVVQNSTKEGFGLVITEAMWKGQPIVGGPASGVREQVEDGVSGFITDNSRELSDRVLYLLGNPEEKEKMGKAAHDSVKEKYLLPRLVLDHLKLYKEVLS